MFYRGKDDVHLQYTTLGDEIKQEPFYQKSAQHAAIGYLDSDAKDDRSKAGLYHAGNSGGGLLLNHHSIGGGGGGNGGSSIYQKKPLYSEFLTSKCVLYIYYKGDVILAIDDHFKKSMKLASYASSLSSKSLSPTNFSPSSSSSSISSLCKNGAANNKSNSSGFSAKSDDSNKYANQISSNSGSHFWQKHLSGTSPSNKASSGKAIEAASVGMTTTTTPAAAAQMTSGYDVWPYYHSYNNGSSGFNLNQAMPHETAASGLLNAANPAGKHFMYDYENCWNRSAVDMAASIYSANTNYANQFIKSSPYNSAAYFGGVGESTDASGNPYAYHHQTTMPSNLSSNEMQQFKSMNAEMGGGNSVGGSGSNVASSPLSVTSSLSSSSSSSLSAVSTSKFNGNRSAKSTESKDDSAQMRLYSGNECAGGYDMVNRNNSILSAAAAVAVAAVTINPYSNFHSHQTSLHQQLACPAAANQMLVAASNSTQLNYASTGAASMASANAGQFSCTYSGSNSSSLSSSSTSSLQSPSISTHLELDKIVDYATLTTTNAPSSSVVCATKSVGQYMNATGSNATGFQRCPFSASQLGQEDARLSNAANIY